MPLCNALLFQYKMSAHHTNVLLIQSKISAPVKEVTTGHVVPNVIKLFTNLDTYWAVALQCHIVMYCYTKYRMGAPHKNVMLIHSKIIVTVKEVTTGFVVHGIIKLFTLNPRNQANQTDVAITYGL